MYSSAQNLLKINCDKNKIGQGLYIFFQFNMCVVMSCQTFEESAAVKQHFF